MRKVAFVLMLLVAAASVAAMAGEEKAGVDSTSGEVTAVDTGKATFTVRPDDGGADSLTFYIDDHTKITQDGKESGLEKLSAGDTVTVRYERGEDGRYVALSVGIG